MIRLHLGAHKTASTHLQQALRQTVGKAAGMVFLGPAELRAPELGLDALIRLGIADPAGKAAAQALRALCAGAADVTLSEENILGTAHSPRMLRDRVFYPEAEARLGRLVEGLASGPVSLCLAVRDPATFLVSAYCQRLYAGHVLPFEEFAAGLDPALLRWSDLVARLLSVPGVTGCTIWRYEDYPAIAPTIAGALLPQALSGRLRPGAEVVHPGLSQAAHDWVMARTLAGDPPDGLARTARQRWPKRPDVAAFAPYDPETLSRSAAAYAADLAALGAQPGACVVCPGGQG